MLHGVMLNLMIKADHRICIQLVFPLLHILVL